MRLNALLRYFVASHASALLHGDRRNISLRPNDGLKLFADADAKAIRLNIKPRPGRIFRMKYLSEEDLMRLKLLNLYSRAYALKIGSKKAQKSLIKLCILP